MIITTENIQHKGNEKNKHPHKRLPRSGESIRRTQKLCQTDQEKYQPQKSKEKKKHSSRELSRKRMHRLVYSEKRFVEGRLDTFEDALQKKPHKSGIYITFLRPGFFLFLHT